MTDLAVVLANVSITESGCHEYQGSRNKDGYGQYHRGDLPSVLAHRLSWLHRHGNLPPERNVLHHCDNPPCINPLHLFLGTQKENVHDMIAKGRANRARQSGESHGQSKLVAQQVDEIRTRYATRLAEGRKYGALTELSRDFGVGLSQIHRIVNGQRWSTA